MTKLKQQIELSLNKELCRHAFHAGVTSEGTNKKELFEDWWCEKMIELNNTEDTNKLNLVTGL